MLSFNVDAMLSLR